MFTNRDSSLKLFHSSKKKTPFHKWKSVNTTFMIFYNFEYLKIYNLKATKLSMLLFETLFER